ncbi:MAG TPA: hypothetical protein VEI53_11340, partial [Ktedonobacteraceae bacterium]|nr:hypothetical protein [Ktedonobacteraceae bacterium]
MSSITTYKTLSNRTIFRAVALVIVIVPLLATVLAIVLLWERSVHWSDLAVLATMYALTMLGITMGFHRMLTHRSFKPHPIIK